MSSSAGGVFLPNDPPPSTGQVLTTPVITGATIVGGTVSGATISGGTSTTTGSTLTTPSISGATIVGVVTVASGATITTPTIAVSTQVITATGATAADAATSTSIYPAILMITGATGSGVNIPSAVAVPGAWYNLFNASAANMRIYSSGATINTNSGVTGVILSVTGAKWAWMACATSGAWVFGST